MGNVLVIAQILDGEVKKSTNSAVTFASQVASSLGGAYSVMALGDETAKSLGVPVATARKSALAAASLATGAATSISGPILFVGLMVPHLLRLILGPDHRLLMPCAVLVGGAFVVVSDTVARTLLAPAEIPVGVITALLGGPFFLWLLIWGEKGA